MTPHNWSAKSQVMTESARLGNTVSGVKHQSKPEGATTPVLVGRKEQRTFRSPGGIRLYSRLLVVWISALGDTLSDLLCAR